MPTAASRSELERLLAEDTPYGDLTTESLGIAASEGEMTFAARDTMVLAEAESAAAMLEIAGCEVELSAASGDKLESGALILSAKGPAAALHRGWKVTQTLIETWAGVATAARQIVEAARTVSPRIAVVCTRKTAPGTKSFAARAVRAGGASMHRLGLSETILVFPEHRLFLAGEPLEATVARLHTEAPEKKLVIEVMSLAEAEAAAGAGFDVIQAEKFTPEEIAEVKAAFASLRNAPFIAAAGGVTLDNATAYARAGADILVTSSPYRAKPRDVQVRFARTCLA